VICINIILIFLLWEVDLKRKLDFLKDERIEVEYLPRTAEILSSQISVDLYDANFIDGRSSTNNDDINVGPDD